MHQTRKQINYQDMDGWIDLTEFATKYGISSSTLRRRIRSRAIEFKLEKGKYLLRDSQQTMDSAPLFSRIHSGSPTVEAGRFFQSAPNSNISGEELSGDLERLQAENRKLREQISELETLVQALENRLGGARV